jgi:hypothetical protein
VLGSAIDLAMDLLSLSSIVTLAEDPSVIPDVLDKDTVKNSSFSTILSSVVRKLTVLGPVSPARNVTDVAVVAKSLFSAVPTCALTLKLNQLQLII